MILRKDEISALVTGVDEIRIIENLDGIFDVTRQVMLILRNKEFLSCNRSCNGKDINITYSECVCLFVT
jgi:hypothetical protein